MILDSAKARRLLAGMACVALACTGCSPFDDEGAQPPAATSATVCSEPSPSRATIAFVDVGEVGDLAFEDGSLYLGLRSLHPGGTGSLVRAHFDTGTLETIGAYGGGALAISGSHLFMVEVTDEGGATGSIVAVDSTTGARTLLSTPVRSPGFVRLKADGAGGVLFLAELADGQGIGVWSWAPEQGDAPALITRDWVAALFERGAEIFGLGYDHDAVRGEVKRLDRDTGRFERLFDFPVDGMRLLGTDGEFFYLADLAGRDVRKTGWDGSTKQRLGSGIDWSSPSGLPTTAVAADDAIYVADDAAVVRIDKESGAQQELGRFDAPTIVSAFGADACYVYAVVEGARKVVRLPKPSSPRTAP